MKESLNKFLPGYSGSVLAGSLPEVEATDATPIVTIKCEDTRHVKDLLISIVTDKGGTIDVVRYMDGADDSVIGKAPVQQVISAGGGEEEFIVPSIGCYKADVIFTKTEAGDTTDLVFSARGEG